jgi:hypothetical protein
VAPSIPDATLSEDQQELLNRVEAEAEADNADAASAAPAVPGSTSVGEPDAGTDATGEPSAEGASAAASQPVVDFAATGVLGEEPAVGQEGGADDLPGLPRGGPGPRDFAFDLAVVAIVKMEAR